MCVVAGLWIDSTVSVKKLFFSKFTTLVHRTELMDRDKCFLTRCIRWQADRSAPWPEAQCFCLFHLKLRNEAKGVQAVPKRAEMTRGSQLYHHDHYSRMSPRVS